VAGNPGKDSGKENEGVFCSGCRETSDRGPPGLRVLTNSATQMLNGVARLGAPLRCDPSHPIPHLNLAAALLFELFLSPLAEGQLGLFQCCIPRGTSRVQISLSNVRLAEEIELDLWFRA